LKNHLIDSTLKKVPQSCMADGSKTSRQLEKVISSLCDQFKKSQPPDLPKLFDEMSSHVPAYTARFAAIVYPQLIDLLRYPEKCPPATNKAIEFLFHMLESVIPGSAATDPYPTLFSNTNFLKAVLRHTGLNSDGEFDQRILTLIHSFMLVKEPTKFVDLLLRSKESLFPLLQACTKVSDYNACVLCNELVICHPDVKKLLVDYIRPLLRQFPPHLAVGLMNAIEELRMPPSDFEAWLAKHKTLTMSDLSQACQYAPALWSRPFSLDLILATTPPERLSFVSWIHRMEPQDLVLSQESTLRAVDSLTNPSFSFKTVQEDPVSKSSRQINTLDLFLFTRLYVLSFADPKDVSQKGIDAVCDLTLDTDVWVAAAALQVIALWVAKYRFVPEVWRVYQIAGQVDLAGASGLGNMYRVVLHFFATVHPIAESILRAERALRFDRTHKVRITRESWKFPHFAKVIHEAPEILDVKPEAALAVLGEIVEYFGIEAA
jgi:hypothetical protein